MKKFTSVIAVILCIIMIICSVPAFAADEKPVYVVLGDSIAAGTGLADNSQCYGALVAQTNGYEYINYGVNGYTTSALLKLLEKEDVQKDIARADFISISIGGNNFLLGGLLSLIYEGAIKKDYSGFDEIIATFNVEFPQIITQIKDLNPDVIILMQTLYNPNYSSLRSTYQQGSDRINNSVKSYLAENPDAYYIVDVATTMEGHFEWVNFDKIHPNASGHYNIAQAILSTLHGLGYGEESVSADAPVSESFFDSIADFLRKIISFFSGLFA